jgi:tetratricopeptide (TPR) repeat protein
MPEHGHESCPHCDTDLDGREAACPDCDGALFGVPPKHSSTVKEKLSEASEVVSEGVQKVVDRVEPVVEKVTETVGEHVIPVFRMVGGVGSDIVEKTSEAASSIKGRLTSDSADEEQASESDEDHEADGDEDDAIDIDALLADGEELGREGKSKAALSKFNQVIAADASNAMAWFNRGVIHEMNGDIEEAQKSFTICLDMQADHGPAAANLAVLLSRSENNDDAARWAHIGLRSFPSHPLLSEIAAGTEPPQTPAAPPPDPTPAPAVESAPLQAEPVAQPEPAPVPEPVAEEPAVDLDGLADLAAQMVKAGDVEDALDLLRDHLHTTAAEDPRCWRIAANAMARMGLDENAIESFNYALELDNEDSSSWYNLGTLHRKGEHIETAATCFETALSLRGDYTNAARALAGAAMQLGRLEQSIDAWRSLLNTEPQHPDRVEFAQLLVDIGEGERAVLDQIGELPVTLPEGPALATEALKHIPDDGGRENTVLRARALTLSGDHAQAVKVWRGQIEHAREDVALWQGLRRTFVAAGEIETAAKIENKIAGLTGEAPVEMAAPTPEITPEPVVETTPDPEPIVEQTPEPEPEPAVDDDPWAEMDTPASPPEPHPVADPVSSEEVAQAESALDSVAGVHEQEAVERRVVEDNPVVDLAKVALVSESAAADSGVLGMRESTSVANPDIEWYNKGLALLTDEKYTESLACFDKALPSFVDDDTMVIRLLNARGNSLYYLERYGECIEAYHKAMSVDPAGVTGATLYNMGTAYGEVERFQDGIKCFEQALSKKRAEPLGGKEADMAKEQIRRFRKLHKEQGKKLKRLAKATG